MAKTEKTDENNEATELLFHGTDFEDMGGRLFRKQIVKFGDWVDPSDTSKKMKLNREWARKAIQNFKDRVISHVTVPVGHTDNPRKNTGVLKEMILTDDGIDGIIDVKKKDVAEEISLGTIRDVSIRFLDQYLDKMTGKTVGPVIKHVALLNDPYLKKMSQFKSLSEALANDTEVGDIMLSDTEPQLNEVAKTQIKEIKNERKFPVEVSYSDSDGEEQKVTMEPGDTLSVPEKGAKKVQKQLEDAEEPKNNDDGGDAGDDNGDEGDGAKKDEGKEEPKDNSDQPSEREKQLEDRLARTEKELNDQKTESEFDKLLQDGYVTPAQKDAYAELADISEEVSLSDGKSGNVRQLVGELLRNGPRVNLSERGKNAISNEGKSPFEQLSEGAQKGVRDLGMTPEQYNKEHSVDADDDGDDDEGEGKSE